MAEEKDNITLHIEEAVNSLVLEIAGLAERHRMNAQDIFMHPLEAGEMEKKAQFYGQRISELCKLVKKIKFCVFPDESTWLASEE